jgi:hypothetical protein
MYFYTYLIVLMSLPPLAQARWGWRGALAAAIGALAFAAAIFMLVYTGGPEPAPADWNPEAKSEFGMGQGLIVLLFALPPAVAILAGVVLAATVALVRFAIVRWKRGTAG